MKFVGLLVSSVLLCAVIVTVVEARRSGGGRRTSSRTRAHLPSRARVPPRKHKPPVNTFLEAERSSNTNHRIPVRADKTHVIGFDSVNSRHKHDHHRDGGARDPPLGFDKVNREAIVKPTNTMPVGVGHLAVGVGAPERNAPSAPLLPSSRREQYLPNAPPSPSNHPSQQNLFQYPSLPNQGQSNLPNAPPSPSNHPSQQNLFQYPYLPNQGQSNLPNAPPSPSNHPSQQNLFQYPSLPNQGQLNAPYFSGTYPNQHLSPYYPNAGQEIVGNKPSAPPLPGTYPNVQQPSYPSSGQYQSNAPSYPAGYPNQQYPAAAQYSVGGNYHTPQNQYHGYSYQNYPTWGQTYPNQQGYSRLQNGNPNIGFYPDQQNVNPFYNYPYPGTNYYSGAPSYPSTGYFGTSSNGLSSYGRSYYSPYPGYTGMFGNSNSRGSIPIPIPIPIPFSSSNNNFDSNIIHDFVRKMMKKIDSSEKNETSVFVVNNSTVTPCETEQFSYNGGTLNLTITTCTVFNCTAVSIRTSVSESGKVTGNNGTITMCLNPNATVATNFSGTAQPKVSEIENYWKLLCVQNISSVNVTNIGNNIIPTVLNTDTTNTQNSSALSLGEDAQLEKENENINATEIGTQSLTCNLTSYPNTDANSTKTANVLQNTTNLELNTNNIEISTLPNVTTMNNSTSSTNTSQNKCEILNCWSAVFCTPTVELTYADKSNITCKQNMSSYTSCVRVKMCKSPSTAAARVVTLNTTVADYDDTTHKLTESHQLHNLTVITYFPPVAPSFGNYSGDVSSVNCTAPRSTYDRLQSASPEDTLGPATNTSVPQLLENITTTQLPLHNL